MLGNHFSEVINRPLLFFLYKKTKSGRAGFHQTRHTFNDLKWESFEEIMTFF